MANRVRFNVLATLLCAVQVFSSCLLVTEHPVYVRREAGHNGGGIDAEISQDATVANDGAWEDRSTDDSVSGDLGATDRVMDDGGANDHASMPDATLDSGGGCGCPLGTRSTETRCEVGPGGIWCQVSCGLLDGGVTRFIRLDGGRCTQCGQPDGPCCIYPRCSSEECRSSRFEGPGHLECVFGRCERRQGR